MVDLTKSPAHINQINFGYDAAGDLAGLTVHYSQNIMEGEVVLTTHSATVNVDEYVADRERVVLVALIKKLSKIL